MHKASRQLGELLDETLAFVRRFVLLTDAQAVAVALWVALTHSIDAFDAAAYLAVTSAEKRCGKTRLLEVLELVVARPWRTGGTTKAALVRKIDRDHPTLLLDETDAAFNGAGEYAEGLRGVLNNGHRRGGNYSTCIAQGKVFGVHDFDVFGPKAIAGIGRLPDTVRDRSIPVDLTRKTTSELVERFRHRDAKGIADTLQSGLTAWGTANISELREARPMPPEALNDRQWDIWEPLLAVAESAGGAWPQRARRAAITLATGEEPEDSVGIQLLRDVRNAFANDERLHTEPLLKRLHECSEAPWPTWHMGKPMGARPLAKLLRAYGIRSKQIRLADQNRHGYERADFEDAWRRFVLPCPGNAASATSQQNSGFSLEAKALQDDKRSGCETLKISTRQAFVADVADKTSEGVPAKENLGPHQASLLDPEVEIEL